MIAAPVIKAPALFEPEPLPPNPFLNIEVVSEISRILCRNLEECQLGRPFRIIPWSISRQVTWIIRGPSTSSVQRFSPIRQLSSLMNNSSQENPSSSPPDSQILSLTTWKVGEYPLILKPYRSQGYLSHRHHSRGRPCLTHRLRSKATLQWETNGYPVQGTVISPKSSQHPFSLGSWRRFSALTMKNSLRSLPRGQSWSED